MFPVETKLLIAKKLVGLCLGATAGAAVDLVVELTHAIAPWVIAGAVAGVALGGGRVGRLGWAVIGCSVVGAFVGGLVGVAIDLSVTYGPESPLREGMKIYCGLAGLGIGLLVGLLWELKRAPPT